ncbi:MAG: hypothetical protein ABR574_03065 [Cryomorphaceae bacterium]|nr:hypothetical protein [Flavobacteriales bacterium]
MKKILILLLAAVFGIAAQGVAQKKMGRYHKNLLYEADIYFVQGDYYYASELYTELCKVEPNNGELLGKLGICYFNLPTMKDEATRYLELAVSNEYNEARYFLAQTRMRDYRFYDALDLLEKYKSAGHREKSEPQIQHLLDAAERGIKMVQAPIPVTIHNLGEQVNSKLHDYAPVWDNSGEKLYFTSRRRYDDNSEKDISEQYDENIFFLNLKSEDPSAFPANEPLNSRTNDAAAACSKDGNTIVIFRTRKDGYSGDLYISEKDHYSWGPLEKLGSGVNSKYQEASASFGLDGSSEIFFSSDRPGGFGGKDIYRIAKLPNGEWGEPQNLGEKINTPYDEDAPFIASDGSLYFASRGHATMGGYDIFCAAADGLDFKKPLNLGFPINTPGDDIFFTLDPTGKMAYFSSERLGGYGLQDIYQVVFDESNTVIFKGELHSEHEIESQNAMVTLWNDESGEMEGKYQIDTQSRTFVLALNTNKKYTLLVEAEGFKPVEKSMYFDSEYTGENEIEELVVLVK